MAKDHQINYWTHVRHFFTGTSITTTSTTTTTLSKENADKLVIDLLKLTQKEVSKNLDDASAPFDGNFTQDTAIIGETVF